MSNAELATRLRRILNGNWATLRALSTTDAQTITQAADALERTAVSSEGAAELRRAETLLVAATDEEGPCAELCAEEASAVLAVLGAARGVVHDEAFSEDEPPTVTLLRSTLTVNGN